MALIIFDYDGVLADTLGDLLLFGQKACNQLGVKHLVTNDDLDNLYNGPRKLDTETG